MKKGNCPECNAVVEVQDEDSEEFRGMRVMDIVDCDECFAELKIMGLNPVVRFAVVNMEREDPFSEDESEFDWKGAPR